jgi:hypothetical protein
MEWRVGIWAWATVGPFGVVEECGKERGNQRVQQGLPVIINPQFSLAAGTGGWPLPWLVLLSVGSGWKLLLGEAAVLSCAVMPLGAEFRKELGKVFFFFSFMSRHCLFIFLYHVVVFRAFELQGHFHPIGLEGIEEKNPTTLCCALPQPCLRLQGGTHFDLPRRSSWKKSDLIARGICEPSLC